MAIIIGFNKIVNAKRAIDACATILDRRLYD